MGEYTPGQWTTRSNCVQVVAEQEDDYTVIADVRCPTQVISGQINHDEQLPNLRLIAAAPDLLQTNLMALEAICAGAEPWMLNDVEMKCRAAIAKARGESNE